MLVAKVLILVLFSEVANMAPVFMDKGIATNDTRNHELDWQLKEELLKDPKNLDTIRNAFGRTPKGRVRVCGRVTYSMKVRGCADITRYTVNYTVPWTSADLSSIAGKYLYMFADIHLGTLGFDWGPICDLRAESAPVLNINAEYAPMACLENWSLVLESLVRLTDQVRACMQMTGN